MRRSRNTNEVWTVPNPKPGTWTVLVEGLQQQYFVTETAQTDVQLRLAVPANVAPGDNVPLTAFFAGPNGGVKGDVWATVTDPARRSTYVHMLDDGAHNDGEAGDGVYGGSYRATGAGDVGGGGERRAEPGRRPAPTASRPSASRARTAARTPARSRSSPAATATRTACPTTGRSATATRRATTTATG